MWFMPYVTMRHLRRANGSVYTLVTYRSFWQADVTYM